MKIALLALTGFGNSALRALVNKGLPPTLVVTRKEPGPFPYYSERQLDEEAAELHIPCSYGEEGEALAAGTDLLITASYHRILKKEQLQSVGLALNVHPSRLPLYRGPNPCYWAIRNGETRTGITIHQLTEELDQGNIYWRDDITIEKTDDQGTLRKKLARITGSAIEQLIPALTRSIISPDPAPTAKGSYFPRPGPGEFTIDFMAENAAILQHFRALMPYPGGMLANRRILSLKPMRNANNGLCIGRWVINGNQAIIRTKTGFLEAELQKPKQMSTTPE